METTRIEFRTNLLLRVPAIVGVMMWVPAVVFAGSPNVIPGDGSPPVEDVAPWANSDIYQECGQSCFYIKGNENLSLQVTYTLMKIRGINEALIAGYPEKVKQSLAGFCRKNEDAKPCAQRYVAEQVIFLTKVKKALVENDTSVLNLDNKDQGGVNAREKKKGKLPQTTFIPDKDKILAVAKNTKPAWKDADQKGWVPPEPNCNDFITFKEVPRNVNEPGAGTLTVRDDSAEGIKKRDAACALAKKKWVDQVAQIRADWENAKNTPLEQTPVKASDVAEIDKKAWERSRRIMIGNLDRLLSDLKLNRDASQEPTKKKTDKTKTDKGDKQGEKKIDTQQASGPVLYPFQYADNGREDMPAVQPREDAAEGRVMISAEDVDRVTFGDLNNPNDSSMLGVMNYIDDQAAADVAARSLVNKKKASDPKASANPGSPGTGGLSGGSQGQKNNGPDSNPPKMP